MLDTCDLSRDHAHERGTRQGMAPGRHIAAAAFDRHHAMAEHEAGHLAGNLKILQAGALFFREEADLAGRKADGPECFLIELFIGSLDFSLGYFDRFHLDVVKFFGIA